MSVLSLYNAVYTCLYFSLFVSAYVFFFVSVSVCLYVTLSDLYSNLQLLIKTPIVNVQDLDWDIYTMKNCANTYVNNEYPNQVSFKGEKSQD